MSSEKLILNGVADDMHVHFRDGEGALQLTVPHVAKQVRRCVAMPNLVPPVTTTEQALAYRERIMHHVPSSKKDTFHPMMTLYMTESLKPEEIRKAKATNLIVAVKYYPAGATTNSDAGVTDIEKIYPVLETMSEVGMPLLVHGEVTDQTVDIFDREPAFIERFLRPLVQKMPNLKIVMEHITTEEAVKFVMESPENVGATITCQHLLYNRNAIFQGGLRPHKYCLPVLKREKHRQALLKAIASGNKKFFMGTDSAPHVIEKKQSGCGCAGIYTSFASLELYAEAFESVNSLHLLEAFATQNGADFYDLERNEGQTVLLKSEWTVPEYYDFNDSKLVPLKAGETLSWQLQE